MTVGSLARSAQRLAESAMADTCTITRPADTPGADPITVYSGKCRVKMSARVPLVGPNAPGTMLSRYSTRVDIPVSAAPAKNNDLVTVDTSVNPNLVGTSAYIDGPMGQTLGSAQRLWCQKELR